MYWKDYYLWRDWKLSIRIIAARYYIYLAILYLRIPSLNNFHSKCHLKINLSIRENLIASTFDTTKINRMNLYLCNVTYFNINFSSHKITWNTHNCKYKINDTLLIETKKININWSKATVKTHLPLVAGRQTNFIFENSLSSSSD